ncbi:MAG: hypothetical protein U1E87_09825 [Alphaproteobacteria bacterium]
MSALKGKRLRTIRARSDWERTAILRTGLPPSLRATSFTTVKSILHLIRQSAC